MHYLIVAFGAVEKINIDGIGLPTASDGGLLSGAFKLTTIVVGSLAVLFLMYGGFQYITANGDSGQITRAKNTILYAAAGIVITLAAASIVAFVGNTAQGM